MTSMVPTVAKTMNEPAVVSPHPRGWVHLFTAWAIVFGATAVLIAIRAPRVQQIDPFVPYFLLPVWLTSLCLASIGTFRLTSTIRNRNLHLFFVVLLLIAQCLAYYIVVSLTAVFIHLKAGGYL